MEEKKKLKFKLRWWGCTACGEEWLFPVGDEPEDFGWVDDLGDWVRRCPKCGAVMSEGGEAHWAYRRKEQMPEVFKRSREWGLF